MADMVWPDDLQPYAVSFYWQTNSIVHESPFTRQTQVLGRSAPRWVAKLSLRGGAGGVTRRHEKGARLEALLMQLRGPLGTVELWDFRRPGPGAPLRTYDQYAASVPVTFWSDSTSFDDGTGLVVTSVGAPTVSGVEAGGTRLARTGIWPGTSPHLVGDYVDVGDGRPHMITSVTPADIDGKLLLTFEPPAKVAAPAARIGFEKVKGTFRLTSDDAGSNPTDVAGFATYELDLVEVL
ncbi:MAG TPA: hypothetical protein VIG90_06695 [Pedomonas sp.]|uniref:hypothetical protein n=1 Tax=Pedomonas sp. TaxID=2976421 RepID=UPI002F413BE5